MADADDARPLEFVAQEIEQDAERIGMAHRLMRDRAIDDYFGTAPCHESRCGTEPETWPRSSRESSPSPRRNVLNFTLEEPAFRTRIASAPALTWAPSTRRAAGVRHQLRNRGGPDAHANVVRATRKHDRHPRSQHDTRAVGTGEVLQAAWQACCRIRCSAPSGYRPAPPQENGCSSCEPRAPLIALSKASGPSRMPPWIWPRSAILHRPPRRASSDVGIDGLDRRKDRDLWHRVPSTCARSDGIAHDVGLLGEGRLDVMAASVTSSRRS